ncbi:MAG: hypothetical protein IPP51_15200 [Bacteroidetes bacterium]|nr:hypothetical protein [Bacteroidota bacterium]
MSFKCVLRLDGKEFNVLNFDVFFDRPVDNFKRPAGEVRGCRLEFTVETTSDSSLFSWFATQFQTKKGVFVFSQRDSEQKMREVEFKMAYIIKYHEHFTAYGETPYLINLGISCNEVRIQDAFMSSFWPDET